MVTQIQAVIICKNTTAWLLDRSRMVDAFIYLFKQLGVPHRLMDSHSYFKQLFK